MYMKILLNYFIGYVKISVEGYFVERFINLCISHHILLWNSKRKKDTLLHTCMSINDFKKLSKIAKQTKCKIKIEEKKGLPFLFHKYKRRKIFFLFLMLMVIGMMVLSNFVWNIEIQGNETIPTEDLLQTIEQEGLKIGVWKNDIDTKEIINKLRLDRDDLAWVGISLKGTNAIVKVVEADKKPEIIPEEEYCNIIATKPGIIVEVNAANRYTPSKRRRYRARRFYSNRRMVRRQVYWYEICACKWLCTGKSLVFSKRKSRAKAEQNSKNRERGSALFRKNK